MSIEVKGLKETQKALYAFSQGLGDRVVYGALREGLKVIQKAAKAEAPKKSGDLRRHIVIKKSKIHNGRTSTGMLGMYLTIKDVKKDLFYGRIQEDGWEVKGHRTAQISAFGKVKRYDPTNRRGANGKLRATTRTGKMVLGKHFINDAFETNKQRAVDIFQSVILAAVEVVKRKTGLG